LTSDTEERQKPDCFAVLIRNGKSDGADDRAEDSTKKIMYFVLSMTFAVGIYHTGAWLFERDMALLRRQCLVIHLYFYIRSYHKHI
jgi:hypothetical protein